jgi:hypothetical protein
VDDIKGQRTGTPAIYEEHMVGFDFWADRRSPSGPS